MGRIFAAIFFKECIKTRFCLLMLTVATLLCMGWIWGKFPMGSLPSCL